MERVNELALISVGRAVGFTALAIGTFMVGLAADLLTCLRTGGILTLITALILLMRGLQAPRRNYKQTEVWIMLNPEAAQRRHRTGHDRRCAETHLSELRPAHRRHIGRTAFPVAVDECGSLALKTAPSSPLPLLSCARRFH
jgi:hypothetical protein